MKKTSPLFIVLWALLVACDQEMMSPETNTPAVDAQAKAAPGRGVTGLMFYGPAQPLGNGTVRTYYKQTLDGAPLEIGMILSEKALQNLPHANHEYPYQLMFHPKANVTGYTHVGFSWNPHGHEPPGVYDLPHFDVHFYTMPVEDVMAIGPEDDEQFNNHPDPVYQPPMYFATPGGVPQMGAHWIDLLAPEFNGGTFTHTFIYGSYDGKFIFYEPMVTLDYLLSRPDETTAIRQPGAYQEDGYYATHYRIRYSQNPGEYIIALTNLTFRESE